MDASQFVNNEFQITIDYGSCNQSNFKSATKKEWNGIIDGNRRNSNIYNKFYKP